MGVDGLTAGIRLQDADGLISVTQRTVSHGVHWECTGAAQTAVCKKQLMFRIFSYCLVFYLSSRWVPIIPAPSSLGNK